MKRVTVTVPATTANLGPGFDCLGMALGLYNSVTMTEADGPLSVVIEGEGSCTLPEDEENLIFRAADLVFRRVGKRPAGLRIHQHNDIPVASGLGSSAAATLAGVLAANALISGGLTAGELLQMAVASEGHPDNVAAALYGGLTLVNRDGDGLLVECIRIPHMRVVIVLPDYELATAAARAALPAQVKLEDAVYNAGRAALLVRALEAGDYDKLRIAAQDRLHQPYRLPLIPGMAAAFAAADEAGAVATTLSGAGPSIAAFAPDRHQAIGEAVVRAFAEIGLKSRVWTLGVDNQGSRVETGR